jgi:hypothetical protein
MHAQTSSISVWNFEGKSFLIECWLVTKASISLATWQLDIYVFSMTFLP